MELTCQSVADFFGKECSDKKFERAHIHTGEPFHEVINYETSYNLCWLDLMYSIGGYVSYKYGDTMYWRIPPEIVKEEGSNRWRGYARLVVS